MILVYIDLKAGNVIKRIEDSDDTVVVPRTGEDVAFQHSSKPKSERFSVYNIREVIHLHNTRPHVVFAVCQKQRADYAASGRLNGFLEAAGVDL
jgi:hypothetical protein